MASASEELEQIYPRPGWVEHDPEAIWQAVLSVGRSVIADSDRRSIAGIGITNQRETTVLWDRETGKPLGNAIVWQDRRSTPLCDSLRVEGLEPHIASVTGLLPDPYFSATKIAWLLNADPGLRSRAASGEICFGTIDSWLIFRLTGGRVHACDATNASRTMLYDIRHGRWDPLLLQRLDIPEAMLPTVRDCQSHFGDCDAAHFGAMLPILGVAGDQQAATYGQACFEPGMIKATFGTGSFVLVNTGKKPIPSKNRMLTTVGWQLDGDRSYALEGAIFMAGATIQWLRDNLGLFADSADTEKMAQDAGDRSGVHLVPAFQGLGAPYWDAEARGAIVGLTRASGAREIVRAGLESVAFQTADLLTAISSDLNDHGLSQPTTLRVDGGMTDNGWLMQFLADVTGLPVEVARLTETTALGAAYHAGLQAGLYTQEGLEKAWRPSARFEPTMDVAERDFRLEEWHAAVARVRSS